jgi:hypothetical protein
MKRLISLFLFSFIFAIYSYAAVDTTVTIGTVPVNQGDTVLVPVTVTNFNNIGAIAWTINYDHSKLTYMTLRHLHPDLANNFLVNDDGNSLIIGWFTLPEKNFGDTKLFDIKFQHKVGSASVCFDASSSVTNYFTILDMPIVFTCGQVDLTPGIREYDSYSGYNVYPNPADGKFTVNVKKDDKEISIYSLNGEVVLNRKIENTGVKNSHSIDIEGLSKGMYIIKIAGNNQNSYRKLVVN